jgi:hypothetical protein
MGALYVAVRRAATPDAAKNLLEQQRLWLRHRDRDCSQAEVSCLRAKYEERRDQLKALNARLIAEDRLEDVTPVMLRGRWRIGAVLDPEGAGAPVDANPGATLLLANLPASGTVVIGRPGEICYAETDCRPIGWLVHTLGAEPGGQRLADLLHIDLQTPVYVGGFGPNAFIVLIQGVDGHLLANFGLCGANASGCRNGFQDWVPDGPESRMDVIVSTSN